MAEVYFLIVALQYWALMTPVAAADAVETPAVIAVWMALEKDVASLSILLVFRVSVSSSLLSATLYFYPRVAIGLVLCRS